MARLPYVRREELPPAGQAIYDDIAGRRGRMLNIFAILMNSPELARRIAATGEYLRFMASSSIPADVREIVTLATAKEWGSQYEWTQHEPLARQAGVREEVISAIRDGSTLRKLLPKEGVFVQFVQELTRERRVRDATFSAVLHLLGPQGTLEVVATVGHYTMLAHIMAALELDLEEGVKPLLPA